MEQPERVWINHPACQYSSRNLWSRTETGAGPDASKITEYIRKDLAILIPPEGPERDDLVEHLTDVIFDSAAEGDERPTWSTAQAAAKAVLKALIGEK